MHRQVNANRKKARMKEAVAQVPQETEEELVFASEHAKLAWEVGEAVSRIIAFLPPEGQSLKATTITFESENLSKGTYALLFSGTVIGTDRKEVFLVPDRSLSVLKQLGIPYQLA